VLTQDSRRRSGGSSLTSEKPHAMPAKKPAGKPHTLYHRDGSVWAKGFKAGETMVGYWEWFRKDGSKLRSGHFDAAGEQVGPWTTYDKQGKIYKVTEMKSPGPGSSRR
jgi:hypothetical protein